MKAHSPTETKLIYTHEDFEETVKYFSKYVEEYPNIVLFSIYQGSLTLGHRLSKEFSLPHSILKYQRIDGKDKSVSVLYDALTEEEYLDKDIFIVDDIWDTGETMEKCRNYINTFYYFPFGSVNMFCILTNNEKVDGLKFQHLNKEKHWVKFLPWEGDL